MRLISAILALLCTPALVQVTVPTPALASVDASSVVHKQASAKKMGKGDRCSKELTISSDSLTVESTGGIFFKERWFLQGEWSCWSVHHQGGRRYKTIMVKQTTVDTNTDQVIREKTRIFHDAYSVWGIAKISDPDKDVDVEIWVDRNGDLDFEGWMKHRLGVGRYPTD